MRCDLFLGPLVGPHQTGQHPLGSFMCHVVQPGPPVGIGDSGRSSFNVVALASAYARRARYAATNSGLEGRDEAPRPSARLRCGWRLQLSLLHSPGS